MSSKAEGFINKAQQERRRGDYLKALKRLDDGIKKIPGSIDLYLEAVETGLEGGETLRAVQFFKTACQRFKDDFDDLWRFGQDKVELYDEPMLCKALVTIAIRNRDLERASDVLDMLKDHTAEELLKRTRTKQQSLTAASGDAFKTELRINTMVEALLCVRTRQYHEGSNSFIQIIDEKPSEHKMLTPYLSTLQKMYPKRGSVAYALGCSCLAARQYEKGVEMILKGISMSPANASDATSRIEMLRELPNAPSETMNLALAKLSIIYGDEHEAAERLAALLKKDRRMSGDILDILEPHVERVAETSALNYLYVEAAMINRDSARALRQIKAIYQDQDQWQDLAEWLDDKLQSDALSTEVLSWFGEMALERQMYDKGVEVFRTLLAKTPQETHVIRNQLEAHLSSVPVKQLYGEIAGGDSHGIETGGDGLSIEHYGASDFTLRSKAKAANTSESPEKRSAGWNEFVLDAKDADDLDEPVTGDVDADMGFDLESELDLSQEDKPSWFSDGRPISTAGERIGLSDEPSPEAFEEIPSIGVTVDSDPCCGHEFEALVDADDAAKPADDAASETIVEETTTKASGEVILLGMSKISDPFEGEASDSAADTTSKAADFDTRYRSFHNGDLDNTEIIDLVEAAARTGRMREMKTLLTFKPQDFEQESKRKYYLAEYYLHDDQPLSALIILRTVNVDELSKEDRKAFLLKNAFCYQQLNRFDAAHGVYLRIMSEYPDFEAAEHMARVSYERHLQSAEGPVLEKLGSLQTADSNEEEK